MCDGVEPCWVLPGFSLGSWVWWLPSCIAPCSLCGWQNNPLCSSVHLLCCWVFKAVQMHFLEQKICVVMHLKIHNKISLDCRLVRASLYLAWCTWCHNSVLSLLETDCSFFLSLSVAESCNSLTWLELDKNLSICYKEYSPFLLCLNLYRGSYVCILSFILSCGLEMEWSG